MPEWMEPFLLIAGVTFVLTGLVLIIFPVEVYLSAKQSDLRDSNKGRFAYSVEALYNVKQKGLAADGKYWWHLFWFNTAVSFGVSTAITFAALVIWGVLLVLLGLFMLWVWANG